MAYSGQFLKLTWEWSVLGTDEIANTSLNFTTSPGWSGASGQLTALGAGSHLTNIYAMMQSLVTNLGQADYSVLHAVKAAAIGTDGTYIAEPIVYEQLSPTAGEATQVPAQVTICASLRSGFTIGGGNYGRMYIPHCLPGMTAGSPYLNAANMADLAGLIKTFVNDVSDEVNVAGPSVVFPAIMSNKGSGTGKQIIQVGTGRVPDTQRRRRNRLDDTATLVSL